MFKADSNAILVLNFPKAHRLSAGALYCMAEKLISSFVSMKYFTFIFTVLLLSCCQGINDSESQIIQSELVGEWMALHDQENSYPSPNFIYRGWGINSDGTIYTLGVNGDTGKIDYYDTEGRRPTNILFANNGKMVVRHISRSVRTDTVSFNMTGNTLNIEGSVLEGSYKRTSIGSEVTFPPAADFFIKIDGTEFKNRPVGFVVPTAYISKISDSKLMIRSYLSEDNHRISVIVDNYQGPGTYSIDEDQGNYLYISGSMASRWITRYDSSGTVTIDCDMNHTRCSGEFSFDAFRPTSSTEPEFMKSFTNGSFDLPVYD